MRSEFCKLILILKSMKIALAGGAQLVGASSEMSQVRLLVRAHAMVAGWVPGRGVCGRQTISGACTDVSLPLSRSCPSI